MSDMSFTDDRIDELLALAALGEITPAQSAELDDALAADEALAAELDADLEVAARLQGLHAQAPPPALKAAVMAALDALDEGAPDVPFAGSVPSENTIPAESDDTRSSDSNVTELSPGRTDHRTEDSGADVSGEVVDLGAARTQRRTRWQPLAAAAAVVMLLVGGVLVAGRNGDGSNDADVIAQADDSVQRPLDGELGGALEVVYSPSQQGFVLVGTDIPALTDEETYQLWLVDDRGAQPVGLFRPDASGRVEQVYPDLDPTDYIVGVTVEPAVGSEHPTLPIVASA